MLWGKHTIGRLGEKSAARYLRRKGFRILGKNVHCGRNELDLIAKNKQYILFVEVKARSFDQKEEALCTRPAQAVDAAKRTRTVQAAKEYLRAHPHARCPRFDVIEVYFDRTEGKKPFKIHHIEGAFDAKGHIC